MRKRIFSLILAVGMVCALAVPASADGNNTIDPEKVMQEMFYRNCMKDGNEHLVPDWFREQYEKEHSIAATVPEDPSTTQKPVEQYYPDVPPDAWYAEAVNAMTKGNLLNGYPDGLFHPDDYVTQGQFAKIYTDIYNYHPHSNDSFMETNGCSKCGNKPIYATEHWALRYAWDACSTGEYVLKWCGHTLDYPVWRGDVISTLGNGMARHMDKYFNYDNYDWKYKTNKLWTESDIPDWNTVPNDSIYDSWYDYHDENGHRFYSHSILVAYNLGITKGIDTNGTCGFFNPMTRAELCQILYNMGITQKGQVRK